MTVMYRQGDILIVEVDAIPEGATPVERVNGNIILAFGESTGHAHVVIDPWVDALEVGGGLYLISPKPYSASHEEHTAAPIKDKTVRVIRQMEYSPEAIRQIAD